MTSYTPTTASTTSCPRPSIPRQPDIRVASSRRIRLLAALTRRAALIFARIKSGQEPAPERTGPCRPRERVQRADKSSSPRSPRRLWLLADGDQYGVGGLVS